jgi:hypothetical protein
MKNFMIAANVDLHEIIINDLQEGVFFAKLVCSTDHDTIEIDSRTSDALAMAVRFGCPIYTYEDILVQAGVLMDDESKKLEPSRASKGMSSVTSETGGTDNLKGMSVKELNELLNSVLEQEDYIKAISIRDELKRRD